ncbi:uncharacterized protein N7503_009384 [Penicillium pulvis]|uniref:uncharacterized protein n=1 Tax=Penicillium pulvis TaxID=1562058 RepID=UPI0025492C53|nr:uncharacterized protein N7503_009384 [Penicillium pulvis]KAJ5793406.1 hypothetical protein N7503_009384 [Penicillium pulvis]
MGNGGDRLCFKKCVFAALPGCHVFTKYLGTEKPSVIYYKLEARYIDLNGENFREAGVVLGILKFRVKTSRKFRSLWCDGRAFIIEDGEPIKIYINTYVGVNTGFFYIIKLNYSQPRFHDKLARKTDGISIIDIDSLVDDIRIRVVERLRGNSIELHQLNEDELLWNLRFPIYTSRESFDCLKNFEGPKKLILSLIETRLGRTPIVPFNDFIAGKGRGLNVLLYGPLGVGKTLIVKATIERFNLPLYLISAGELNVDHRDLNALDK